MFLDEIIEAGVKPPEELIEGVILRGKVHAVYGETGQGKSWLALWAAKLTIEGDGASLRW